MVHNVAPLFAELEPRDFYLLSGIEHGMRFSELVDRDKLPKLTNLTKKEVNYRLERCLKRELIEKRTIHYEGYRLTFEGYDALALRSFAESDIIDGIGAQIGVGKESDVYEARSFKPMVVKYHREGIGNFRNLNRERDYTADKRHTSDLYTARKAAEREFDILETLYPTVTVPQPIQHNRHAIVMEKMAGKELSKTKLTDDEAASVLIRILREIEATYHAGLVHADLSAYNVFVTPDETILFDWPQAVSVAHDNAAEFLSRDIDTIRSYFVRKHPGLIPEKLTTDCIVEAIVEQTVEQCVTTVDLATG